MIGGKITLYTKTSETCNQTIPIQESNKRTETEQ